MGDLEFGKKPVQEEGCAKKKGRFAKGMVHEGWELKKGDLPEGAGLKGVYLFLQERIPNASKGSSSRGRGSQRKKAF